MQKTTADDKQVIGYSILTIAAQPAPNSLTHPISVCKNIMVLKSIMKNLCEEIYRKVVEIGTVFSTLMILEMRPTPLVQ